MNNILEQYLDLNELESVDPFGSGHINDTFKVTTKDSLEPNFLLQRVNHEVFTDVPLLMNNMEKVCAHLKKRLSSSEEFLQSFTTMDIIHSSKDQNYVNDEKGNFWRILEFKEGYHSHDLVETIHQAYQGGKAFGQFLHLLDDFPMESIGETIPKFHDIGWRLEQLEQAKKEGIAARIKECKHDLKYVEELSGLMLTIKNLRQNGVIRDRVTHNDTKFNNVLLSADGKKSCVVDLDTVMPGVVHYDFGDGIRTSATTCAEDETDFSKIQFDIDKFTGFATGYLNMTRTVLEPVEIAHLSIAGPLLAYIMGVRFLTDYLLGDHYYKISRPKHNLERARCQLELTRKMLERKGDMEKAISDLSTIRTSL